MLLVCIVLELLRMRSDCHDSFPFITRRVLIIRKYPSLARGETKWVFVRYVRPVLVAKHTIWHLDSGAGQSGTCPNLLYPRSSVTLDRV